MVRPYGGPLGRGEGEGRTGGFGPHPHRWALLTRLARKPASDCEVARIVTALRPWPEVLRVVPRLRFAMALMGEGASVRSSAVARRRSWTGKPWKGDRFC